VGILRDIAVRFGPAYERKYGAKFPGSHRRALHSLADCRTDRMGGHAETCNGCAATRFVPHSCRDRLCPSCHAAEIDEWTAKRAVDILPVQYFHFTFPLPSELRMPVRSHQKALEDALIRAAAESLAILAQDRLGGRIGITAALHTWGRALPWHPHVHCLVPAAVVHPDDTVTVVKGKFLLPVRALSKVFRAVFLRMAREAVSAAAIPEIPWGTDWVVNVRRCSEGPGNVIRYLARYAKRGPLAEGAIVRVDDRSIVFRYLDHRTGRTATCTLTPEDFLARYLQHAPPPGFHRVRHYGILAPGARRTLRAVQLALLPGMAAIASCVQALREPAFPRTPQPCPACGCTSFVRHSFTRPRLRDPPRAA